MKSKKWLNYTLGVLITLIVLTAVAGAGFRAGTMQNPLFSRVENGARPFAHDDFSQMPQSMQGNPHGNKILGMTGNFQGQMSGDGRGLDFRGGGFRFPFPIFGLIQLAVLALVVWLGYKLIRKSGWRLSLSKASPASISTPTSSETPSVEVEKKR